MLIEIRSDGSCNNADKTGQFCMGVGVAVFIDKVYCEDYSLSLGFRKGEAGMKGNTVIAEWIGVVNAFKIAKDLKKVYPHAHIAIFGDNERVVQIFNGECNINPDGENAKHYQQFKTEAHSYSHSTGCRRIIWQSREFNKFADTLASAGRHRAIENL